MPTSITRMPSSGPVTRHRANPCRCSQSVHDADRLAQRAALVRSGVVVVGAGDLVHLLIRMPDGFEEPAGVAGRAGVVGEVADHQRGHRDIRSGFDGVAVGVVVAPLRQPAAQRAEPGEADRAVVHHLRVAQVAGPRGAFVGVDGRVEPARVGHGAVHDEGELVVGPPGCLELGEFFLDPLGDSPVARDLRLAVSLQEFLRCRAAGWDCPGCTDPARDRGWTGRTRRGWTRPATRSACRAG